MAKLRAAARDALPGKDFALPGRRFPIEDAAHGRKALQLEHNASPAERSVIERKVHAKFPSIARSGGWA